MNNIAFQPELRPALKDNHGPKDYRDFRERLESIDGILRDTGLEDEFVHRYLLKHAKDCSHRQLVFRSRGVYKAIRYSLLLALTGLSYRGLAERVADSDLMRWFVGTEAVDACRSYSKSSIERLEKLLDAEDVARLVHDVNRLAMDAERHRLVLPDGDPLDTEKIFTDTTCLVVDIHFPTDWVLLRDAAETLVKAIELIRRHGLLNRMEAPSTFMRRMNKLCIEMTHSWRRRGGRKLRKRVLRDMKKLSGVIDRHARRHRDILAARWAETDLSEAQGLVIINRIDNIRSKLPEAMRQAHERIIGGRLVPNSEKMLSLYDDDVHVIVRGKAGARVEFGNGLLITEQSDGLIVDWEHFRGQPPADSRLVRRTTERITGNYGAISAMATDRGFDSADATRFLEGEEIFNAICPKDPAELRERAGSDALFAEMQTRRSSTEARIAIIKNAYLGQPMRGRCFESRDKRLAWCVLAHNLTKLVEIVMERRGRLRQRKAA